MGLVGLTIKLIGFTFKDECYVLIPEIQLNFLHSDFSEAGMNSLADANLGVIGGSTQFSLDGVVSSAITKF